ncbi:MAG: hypothetical protein K0B37_10915 [Bacteroidales bacterium]|nr:hypothetical protein [Bacteroidales bacterium]
MKYLRITDQAFHDDIQGRQGIYFLHSLDEYGKPKPTQRLLGTDEEGILYIGTTKGRTLSERLADFRKTVLKKSESHIAGRKYKQIPILMKNYPDSSLAFSFIECEDPPARESDAIREYINRFGEKPPLNSM